MTVAVFHLVNINTSMPRDATGRRRLGDIDNGSGGSIGYVTKDPNGRLVRTPGVHAHLEIYNGRHTTPPERGKKPHTNFNGVFP